MLSWSQFPIKMAIAPSSSVVELTSDVTVAVERLRELGFQMQDDSYSFSADDIKKIDDLVHHLEYLDSKRQKVHEFLEAETIKTSIIRHKLATFPQKLQLEIEEKIKAARDSNEEYIKNLQLQVSDIADRTVESLRTHKLLSLHNEMLEASYKELAEKNDKDVKLLNACMSEKTKIQMKLNELLHEVEVTEGKNDALKIEISELQEEMKKVMTKFTTDVLTLDRALETTRIKKQATLKEIDELKKKLGLLQEVVLSNQLKVDQVLNEYQMTDGNVRKLLLAEKELKQRLVDGDEYIEELQNKCVQIEVDTVTMTEEYQIKELAVLEKASQFKKEVDLVLVDINSLSAVLKKLNTELKHVSKEAADQASTLKDCQNRLVGAKDKISTQTKEGERLMKEYNDTIIKLQELRTSHEENVRYLNDDISDLQYKLDTEMKTTEMLKENNDKIAASIESFKKEHIDVINHYETKITNHKRESSDLSIQLSNLKKVVEEKDTAIQKVEKQLKYERQRIKTKKEVLTTDIQTAEENIADLTEEVKDRTETIRKIEPQCMALEGKVEEKTECYDVKKKEVIALKSKRSEIEDRIKKLEKNLNAFHTPRQKMKMDILRCRAYTRQALRQWEKEVEELEKHVMEASQKVLVINSENKRIVEASENLSQEIKRMKETLQCSRDIEAQLDATLERYRDYLEEQWRKNKDLEKISSVRDEEVLKDITKLKEISQDSLEKTSSIHENFEKEIQKFTNFLAVTASGQC